jgi:putative membrane protein
MGDSVKRLRFFPDVRLDRDGHSEATEHHAKGIHLAQEVEGSAQLIGGDAGSELASIRTTLAFDRTGLASDRTLMAVVRTALALIGFGFTIFTFFHTLSAKYLELPEEAPRRFGGVLILLGVILLTLGILNHRQQAKERRRQRQALFDQKLVHQPEIAKTNATMVIAILLLLVGLAAILRVIAQVGPF